jgi:hypothetical protein
MVDYSTPEEVLKLGEINPDFAEVLKHSTTRLRNSLLTTHSTSSKFLNWISFPALLWRREPNSGLLSSSTKTS